MNEILPSPSSIDYGSQHDVLLYEFLYKNWKTGISIYREKLIIQNTFDELKDWLDAWFGMDGIKILQTRDDATIIESSGIVFIVNCDSMFMRVDLYGQKTLLECIVSSLRESMVVAEATIRWVYSEYGDSLHIPIGIDKYPLQEMYPFLGEEKLEDYYDRFMESNANILLLIGPPGTGKTSFIRGLIMHSKKSAIMTYDQAILSKDHFFVNFLEGNSTVLILEDSDTFLLPRSEHNSMMHKFLNLGDGIISSNKKKLIFSTNLPSITDIDSALVRPGRCFDVLHFGSLNLEQAQKLADKSGIKFSPNEKDSFTIAEIYNSDYNGKAPVKKSIGFC